MSPPDHNGSVATGDAIHPLLQEARKLIERLEGSTVTRLSVKAGGQRIEIERGLPPALPSASAEVASEAAVPMAIGPGPGPGVSPGGRGASGVHMAIRPEEADNRVAVLAPLVGTFYRSAKPGEKAFVEQGDTVDAGQTVCIVEAMKLMNEVGAAESGKVVEIVVENGEWVEFEQVLMYIEPPEE